MADKVRGLRGSSQVTVAHASGAVGAAAESLSLAGRVGGGRSFGVEASQAAQTSEHKVVAATVKTA